ncbi:MAG: phosphoribosylglycinamide formyltransferase [Dysgonomonas sp.]|jgi:phosphoribosylglycinamide formyltransferase-1|uniref:phosphoribosylglycinamide formyltransferase n=1 Tax=unclassified Dysgonomonas TaxID=2630389 RepID=UPI0025C209B4|nr:MULTISPECIES: phosphoribosylglycinamide formyltransferase [unclassified Dysgonomonas]MDR2004913.1 phosphoribosylglycinamide formyltransferase [Prevotella sp.]HMM01673.1 phosphoribosylglycinamide formyltransferase [Dysgonomonas sp.]
MTKIAIFASGSGSNAENIIKYFANNEGVNIKLIVSNKEDAYVHQRAKNLGIESVTYSASDFYHTDKVLECLLQKEIDFIVLAGFLLKIPENLLRAYPNKIINIHPALLPKFGGKGMYGDNVHKAVVESGETESGITIHYVNENYDEGTIIFQAKCPVSATDSYEDVAKKVHALEYTYFPVIIDKLLNKHQI